MTEAKTEYYFSKMAIIVSLLLLLIFFLLFTFATYILYSSDLKAAMFICLFFFLLFLGTFPSFYKRFSFFIADTPALILTKNELIDNINLQIFKWTDIQNISSESIKTKTRIKYIAISLIKPDTYIDVIKNPYKRTIARLNQNYFGGAFSIQPNLIKCKSSDLLQDMTKHLDNSYNQNSR